MWMKKTRKERMRRGRTRKRKIGNGGRGERGVLRGSTKRKYSDEKPCSQQNPQNNPGITDRFSPGTIRGC